MAVRDDLVPHGQPDERADVLGRAALEDAIERHVARARDVPVPRIARRTRRSLKLLRRPDVDQHETLLSEPVAELLEGYVHCERNSSSRALKRSG